MKKSIFLILLVFTALLVGAENGNSNIAREHPYSITFYDHENCEQALGSFELDISSKELTQDEILEECEIGFSDGPYRNIDAIEIDNTCFKLSNTSDYSLEDLRQTCKNLIIAQLY